MARVVRVSDLRNACLPPVVVWPPEPPDVSVQKPVPDGGLSSDERGFDDPVFVLGQVRGVLNMERGGMVNQSKALKQLRVIVAGFEKGFYEK